MNHVINIPENIIFPTKPVTGANVMNSGDNDIFSPNSTSPNIISQDSMDSCDDESLDNTSIKTDGVHASVEIDNIVDDINAAMDGDVEHPEISQIIQHQFNGGILEFLCRYDTGETEWHPLSLVKKDDPYSVANYIMQNDLGKAANNIHRRWACLFLRTVCRVCRQIKRSNCFFFIPVHITQLIKS